MLTAELLTTVGGSLVGFVMKLMAIRSQQQNDMMLKALELDQQANNSANDAAARVSGSAGKFVRRAIVLAILFAVVFIPLLAPMWGLPVVVEGEQPGKTVLWGLISEPATKIFTEINGVLLIPELRQVLLAIVGFYFGTSTARAR